MFLPMLHALTMCMKLQMKRRREVGSFVYDDNTASSQFVAGPVDEVSKKLPIPANSMQLRRFTVAICFVASLRYRHKLHAQATTTIQPQVR